MTITTSTSGSSPPRQKALRQTPKNGIGWSSAIRRIIAICGLVGILGSGAIAQATSEQGVDSSQDNQSVASENTGVPVEIDGRPILFVYAQIAGFTPQDRAAAIERRIIDLGKTRDIAPEAIRAEERGTWTEIMAGDERIMGVTEADAMTAERRRADLAAEYTEIIRLVVKQYRVDHTWLRFLWAVLYSILASAGVVGLVILLFLVRHRMRSKVERWLGTSETEVPVRSTRPWLRRYLGQPLVAVGRAGFLVLGSSSNTGLRHACPEFLSFHQVHFKSDYKLAV